MKKISNLLFTLLIVWVIAKDLGFGSPYIGKTIRVQNYKLIESGNMINLPHFDKEIWIYWATWCAPCKLEMERLADADLDHQRVFAINLGEARHKIERFLAKNKEKYPFRFVIDKENNAFSLGVRATPTVFHIKNGKISWMKEGMSLFGIWRAENHIPYKSD